ncbi:uncharacterized protein DNG_08252 [Cephalotrichum gorgonifer]|uniref:6-phosphogluconate dehydrogenase NADP-binding domain-containing protein n=1 Tax=Cephalotrichum gorgonifer TaxID=2041049 RepID=A0AAE8SY64_9PEZI|nr:uncharacterized protein DNG_08252 [Cephalotrichum gorgonifer]
MSSATFLGLGNMGSALAQQLAKSNTNVTAWNRTQDRPGVKAAVEAGATYEPSAAAAIAKNDIVVVCLLNYAALTEVFAALPEGALSGKTVINFTNGTPNDASDMGAAVLAKGAARYFDGAIMVPPYVVGTPGSTFVISGESQEAYSTVSGLLAAFGSGQYLGSETGAASRFDNGLLVQMYGMFLGMFLGLGIMKKGSPDGKIGSSIDGMVPLVQALVPLMGMIAARWDADEHAENDGHPMNMLVESVETIRRTCEESGVDFGTMELFLERMKAAEKSYGALSGLSAIGPAHLKE